MTTAFLIGGFVVGGCLGLVGAALALRMAHRRALAQAEALAAEQVQFAQSEVDQTFASLKEAHEDERDRAFEEFERANQKTRERILSLEVHVDERQEQLEEKVSKREADLKKQEHVYRSRAGQIKSWDDRIQHLRERCETTKVQLLTKLETAAEVSIAEVKEQIRQSLVNDCRSFSARAAQAYTEEFESDLEREAKWHIYTALARFPRPYCAERGIGNVNFANEEIKTRVLGPERVHLREVEKTCGVDISIHEEYQSASVLGYDPVRREWGRLTLERLLSEKKITSERIQSVADNAKRDLFKKIIKDGNRLAAELKIEGLHEDIRHMMGALRYRYSFAQNQHFHCAEVGFLCGLLAAEMGVPVKDGRRSGFLHDIGKAMDHSKDGGHAVIGADFIEAHGEAPHVVHAVRAHHYDETPSSDLAYLVIAADAISGARPGARRSTADSYSQKIEDLQNISNSFPGVVATYIMSAGREVRVVVNSQQVDDQRTLELSKQIARKIEEECSYPGLIKLTVVRETHAFEMAR